jgi:outer membrane protein TolC
MPVHRWCDALLPAGRAGIVTSACAAAALAAVTLGGCASFSPDGGMDAVSGVAAAALGRDARKVDTREAAEAAGGRVRRLLASKLSADAAVEIALLNNKGLQAAYNELGLAEAARVEASLPPNPAFSLSRISTSVELDVERRLVGDILALATLPVRSEIAADRFRQAQLAAAQQTLRAGVEARRNYYRAVASHQLVAFLDQAHAATETAAKLAAELGRTGAMNKLDQAREQSFDLELAAQLASARQRAQSDREALVRSLGLWGGDIGFRLPEALPALPRRPQTLPGAETEAVRRRVDLQIARIEVEALARSYGLTSATRFINLLDVAGVSRTQREPGGPHGTGGGVEVEFQVPIFDFGEVRLRQAGEAYMQAVNRLTEKAVNARSQARDAWQAYRSTYGIAVSYRDRILPLRQVITDETMLRYGAMQIDVFALLTEARQRVAVNIAAIEAQRDFWLASASLTAAIAGGGPASDAAAPLVATGSAVTAAE